MQNSSCVWVQLHTGSKGPNEAKMSAMKNIYYDFFPLGAKEEVA